MATKPKPELPTEDPEVVETKRPMEETVVKLLTFGISSGLCAASATFDANWTAAFFAIITIATLVPLLPSDWPDWF